MEVEKLKTREVRVITRMALEMFDEFRFDENVLLFYDEEKGIEKAVEEVAPKVVEVAKQYKLPRKATAAITLAVAMSRFLSFVYITVECRCSTSRIVKIMESLGFKRVKNKCVEEIVDAARSARWNVAEEFLEALGRSFVVLDIGDILIFEPQEG